MKIVRLDKKDLSEWRSAHAYLVGPDGRLVEELSTDLTRALETLSRSARSQRKTLSQSITVKTADGPRIRQLSVVITRTGMHSHDIAASPTIDGHRIVTGRDVVCARKLQEHGECQLRMPNGVILKVVRNPALHRPTFLDSQKMAPAPDLCPCAHWGNPHPGRHYPTCVHNRHAPPHEQALSPHIPEQEARALPTEAFASLAQRPGPVTPAPVLAAKVAPAAVPTAPSDVDSPETCRNGCLDWATPRGVPIAPGHHHPTCQFARAWAQKVSKETPRWLVDIHTGERVRRATDQEIGESDVVAQRTGAPILHIEERAYAVITEAELVEAGAMDAAGRTTPAPLPMPAPEPGVVPGVITTAQAVS